MDEYEYNTLYATTGQLFPENPEDGDPKALNIPGRSGWELVHAERVHINPGEGEFAASNDTWALIFKRKL